MEHSNNYDVIIVGGSYAGLSAALALGRALRKVLIIDSGNPCNRQTPHSHNFITQDGSAPEAIRALALEQVLRYDTVQLINGEASGVTREEGLFTVHAGTAGDFQGRKLLLSTGLADRIPDIPGFAECWGISVLHCPYCHGYEVRGQHTAILANGEAAMHYAMLLGNWTNHLTVLTNGKAGLTEEQRAQLQVLNVGLLELPVQGFEHENGRLKGVLLEGHPLLEVGAMYSHVPFRVQSELPGLLGCELNDRGLIVVDELQKTSVPGVYAAGDNSNPQRAVSIAVATGTRAGAAINWELTTGAL